MDQTVKALLQGKGQNHLLPFFWQHGENETTLREYMGVIQKANCNAVCVESRPHPDFCGPDWWRDMDIILDEARRRGMKVWILDDSHFPTGYANGAAQNAPDEIARTSLCANPIALPEAPGPVELALEGLIPPPFKPIGMEAYILPHLVGDLHYEGDRVLGAVAFCPATGESVDLTGCIRQNTLVWAKPAGEWTVWVLGLSRNCGAHRNYINMMDEESCRLLIDAVYEPHWQHYRADFGSTIAGFFSDEPELGNGHLYFMDNLLGTDQDLPYSRGLAEELARTLGQDWLSQLFLLWENEADPARTARVRYAYMDAVTRLVRQNFSRLLGRWCEQHGVEYIGHVIEDGNAHARTGSSLGHYFRGLEGQHMAGIDDIGGQVYPQGEDDATPDIFGRARDGEFFHFCLGRLASSAAAIEPKKQGRAMCEIFGNYGWAEGVHLEKYLADHFMVRGVNQFVPHAFNPKAFPDTDCPPHFYAHGHNPQYRHFGALCGYMNRVSELISGGRQVAQAAVLYHAEAEWAGKAMLCQKPARLLEEHQIGFDFLPCDVFAAPEAYGARLGSPLEVNGQAYRALVVPYAQFLPAALVTALACLHRAGLPVLFLEALPQGVCDGPAELLQQLAGCPVLPLQALPARLAALGLDEITLVPASVHLRCLRYRQGEGELFYFVNESAAFYQGNVTLPAAGPCYLYDAWNNRLVRPDATPSGSSTRFALTLAPSESALLVFGTPPAPLAEAWARDGRPLTLAPWRRSICEGIDYPAFGEAAPVALPDPLAQEQPEFSGFVRYESSFEAETIQGLCLEIENAAEGVEVFVNGASAGLQILPPYRYDLSALARPGRNRLTIEVATTLERKCAKLAPNRILQAMGEAAAAVTCGSGLTGAVRLYQASI